MVYINIQITWTITAIIAISSIISPIIVTILNNNHDYKVRKLENDSKIKQEILSNFALSVTREFKNKFVHDDFRQSLNLLYVYFDVDDALIDNIVNIEYANINDFQKSVTKLMRQLSKQIKSK